MSMYEVKHVDGELLGHYEAEDADDAKFDAVDDHDVEFIELVAEEI